MAYASDLFLSKLSEALAQADQTPDSPLADSSAGLRALAAEMATVAAQSREVGNALEDNDAVRIGLSGVEVEAQIASIEGTVLHVKVKRTSLRAQPRRRNTRTT